MSHQPHKKHVHNGYHPLFLALTSFFLFFLFCLISNNLVMRAIQFFISQASLNDKIYL